MRAGHLALTISTGSGLEGAGSQALQAPQSSAFRSLILSKSENTSPRQTYHRPSIYLLHPQATSQRRQVYFCIRNGDTGRENTI